jgi:hypothetical protein
MMMRNSLLAAIIFVAFTAVSQIEPIEIVGINPVWIHQTIDQGVVNDTYNGSNHLVPNLVKHADVYDEDYIYLLNTAAYNAFSGGYLQKINYRTGVLVWSTFYDLRNNDNQSVPSYYRVVDDCVEIVGFRNESTFPAFWVQGIPEIRCFATEDGAQGEVLYSADNVHNLDVFLDKTVIFPSGGEEYCYFDKSYSFESDVNSWKDSLSYIDNTASISDSYSEVHMGEDTSTGRYIYSPHYLSGPTIANTVNFFSKENYLEDQETILRVFDASNRQFLTYDLTGIVETNYDFFIKGLSENSVTLYTRKYSNDDVVSNDSVQYDQVVVVDLLGETAKQFEVNLDQDPNYLSAQVFTIENGDIVVINTYRQPSSLGVYEEYYKLILLDSTLEVKSIKEIAAEQEDRHYQFWDCKLLPNDMVFLTGSKAVHDSDDGRGSLNSLFSMGIDAEDLGITTSTQDLQAEHRVTIYPNPTYGAITVDLLDYDGRVDVKIFDALGRIVYDENHSVVGGRGLAIDLSTALTGIYAVEVRGQEGVIAIERLYVE